MQLARTFSDVPEILSRPAQRPEEPGTPYMGFNPSSTVLPQGHQRNSSCRPLPVSLIWDRDIPLPLRDGRSLRADVFRPADQPDHLPALIAWSPYGKTGAGRSQLSAIPGRAGIPADSLSGYEKWEAPDPAEWCPRGYAVVNIDARGVFDSDGDIRWLGTSEGQDGADAVEAVAALPWSSGRVAPTGNSWLSMSQWFIAAERPPHLTCIAPMEGVSDFYRETACRGGVPNMAFWEMLLGWLSGRNEVEDVPAMLEKYPMWNDYWADKRAQLDRIEVPAYILASYSTLLHTEGSFRGFEQIASKDKWLTVHATQEWYDLYSDERIKDLARFLDRYMKDEDNGWEQTPRVRASVLGFNQADATNVPFQTWPPQETRYEKLYLAPEGSLSLDQPSATGNVSYPAGLRPGQTGYEESEVAFVHTFSKPATLLGYSKAVLYMSAPSHDDMDVFVQLRKASADGTILDHLNIPIEPMGFSSRAEVPRVNPMIYLGPTGILRASHRKLDQQLSSDYHPVLKHDKLEKVRPGETTRLEIAIWPSGMRFEAGEKLVVKVAGHPQGLPEFAQLAGKEFADNKGENVVHFGGETASHLSLPFV